MLFLQQLMNDVDSRKHELKSAVEKTRTSFVPDCLQQQVNTLQCDWECLKSQGDGITQQLTQSLGDRQALHNSVSSAKLWIEEKKQQLGAGKTLPLASADVKKRLKDCKVAAVGVMIS